jgi:hypothetical protein
MTEFDARITKRNQRSNDIINKLLKDMKQKGRPRIEQNMLDRVIRPFVHVLNECEVKEVDPVQANEAVVSTIVTMCSELMVRTIPRGNTTIVHTATQDFITDFTTAFLGTVTANFGVAFELSQPNQPPLAGTPGGGWPPAGGTH